VALLKLIEEKSMRFEHKEVKGKVLGKGLIYIEAIDDTHNLEELSELTTSEFSMLLSFCNEKELDSLLSYMQSKDKYVKESMILQLMNKLN
jgi:hypothetical protein